MPKNLVIYTTSRVRTTKLMRIFADGINTQSPNEWDIKILPIDSLCCVECNHVNLEFAPPIVKQEINKQNNKQNNKKDE